MDERDKPKCALVVRVTDPPRKKFERTAGENVIRLVRPPEKPEKKTDPEKP